MVQPGDNVTFTVAASGDSPMYQWSKDDDVISDADGVYGGTTTSELTVFNALEPEDEGVYTVRVSNTAAEVNSSGATLEIGGYNKYY